MHITFHQYSQKAFLFPIYLQIEELIQYLKLPVFVLSRTGTVIPVCVLRITVEVPNLFKKMYKVFEFLFQMIMIHILAFYVSVMECLHFCILFIFCCLLT